MFKFVVVLACVAAAVADPDPALLLSAPYVQPYAAYSTVVSPATTSISSSSSSVIHPSPITYASPLGFSHFIKKRSADPQFLATTYNAPFNYYPTSYQYPSAAVISTPTLYGASLPLAAHLIKKRSADPQFLATPYITPTTYYANPAISTPYLQTPYYGAQLPLINTHFIKKRSAEATPEPAADPQFWAPGYLNSGYFKTISTPYVTSPSVVSNYYPAASAFPLATTHFIKKRAAEAEPEAAAEPSADPQYYRGYPNLWPGSPVYSSYPGTTVIKSSPIYTANPFVYSSYIKK